MKTGQGGGKPLLRAPIFCVLAVATIGCKTSTPTYSSEYKTKFEKRVGADETKARAFVNSIAGIAPHDRADYVRSHEADARNLGLIPDQDLQAKYKSLMLSGR